MSIKYIKLNFGKYNYTDSTTVILKPFINDLLERMKDNDILKCPEFFKINNELRTNIVLYL